MLFQRFVIVELEALERRVVLKALGFFSNWFLGLLCLNVYDYLLYYRRNHLFRLEMNDFFFLFVFLLGKKLCFHELSLLFFYSAVEYFGLLSVFNLTEGERFF